MSTLEYIPHVAGAATLKAPLPTISVPPNDSSAKPLLTRIVDVVNVRFTRTRFHRTGASPPAAATIEYPPPASVLSVAFSAPAGRTTGRLAAGPGLSSTLHSTSDTAAGLALIASSMSSVLRSRVVAGF